MALPPWVQDGGHEAMIARLQDPATRKRVLAEMKDPDAGWENLRLLAGSDERVLFIGFKNEKLKPLTGKSLAEVAKMRGRAPENAWIGTTTRDPEADLATLARGYCAWAEGPVTEPDAFAPALKRAIAEAEGGAVAVLDVRTNPR